MERSSKWRGVLSNAWSGLDIGIDGVWGSGERKEWQGVVERGGDGKWV